MKYDDFVSSLKSVKIHKISDFGPKVHLRISSPYYLLGTSGSTKKKYYLHSVSSIKSSVESFLKIHPLGPDDRYWVSLSTKHVAGFSILSRSHFGGLKKPLEDVFILDVEKIKKENITVLSLVPTQIFDIVTQNIDAPSILKYVFVGGAPLSSELFDKAKKLGWPLVPCFGSTETLAQFSYSKNNKVYELYPGWGARANSEEELEVEGSSLFSYEVSIDGSLTKRHEGWYNLSDKVLFKDEGFSFLGKSDGRYKHKGSYQNFNEQKKEFEALLLKHDLDMKKFTLVVLEEERSGAGLYLLSSDPGSTDLIHKEFSDLRGTFHFESLDEFKSEIGKPIKSRIEDALLKPLLLL